MKKLLAKYQSFKLNMGPRMKWWTMTPKGFFLVEPIVVLLVFVVLGLLFLASIVPVHIILIALFGTFLVYTFYYGYIRKEELF